MNIQRDLERAVFGGSESELSSDEDDEPQLQQQPVQDDVESDDYVQPKPTPPVGKPAKKKVPKRRPDPAEPARSSKKRKRKQPVEIDLSELPPEQANKIRLDLKIDEILHSSKKSSTRKKKSATQVLDSFADDQVARLRETMNSAVDEDLRANQEKQPALAKLRMLSDVVVTLSKASLAQSIMDNNLLDAVRRFLEPLPDRSLPALSIQRQLFASLSKMEWIDSPALKESGLGRIVLFYTKCKRVERDISNIAKDLVQSWSRPIVGRSKEYRDRLVPHVAEGPDPARRSQPGGGRVRTGEKMTLASILARAKEEENRPGARKVRKNAVSIPQRELGTYVVAPPDELGLTVAFGAPGGGVGGGGGGGASQGAGGSVRRSIEMDVERRRKNAERLRNLTKKVATGGNAAGQR